MIKHLFVNEFLIVFYYLTLYLLHITNYTKFVIYTVSILFSLLDSVENEYNFDDYSLSQNL